MSTEKKYSKGFTIVELLIVIVVIAVLAGVSIVAYGGIQQRARNAKRVNDVVAIQKALELFRADKGRYPYAEGPGAAANLPAGFSPPYGMDSYSYSIATNNTWLKELRDSGFAEGIPVAPGNNMNSYYIYYAAASIGSCAEPVYMLAVVGWEGGLSTMPKSPRAQSLNCSISGVVTAHWVQTGTRAIFSNLDHPNGT